MGDQETNTNVEVERENPFENFVDDVMEYHNLQGDKSYVWEDKNYGTKYIFFKDHAVVNSDRTDFTDVRYEYGSDPEHYQFIEDIVNTSRKLDELVKVTPPGNLQRYGGERGLAKSILMVTLAERGPQPSEEKSQ